MLEALEVASGKRRVLCWGLQSKVKTSLELWRPGGIARLDADPDSPYPDSNRVDLKTNWLSTCCLKAVL